jgi:hypothetical protein
MSRVRGLSFIALAAVAAFALTGCDPDSGKPLPSGSATGPVESSTPSPTPALPELGSLVLTTEGLGELAIGSTPPSDNPDTNLVSFDASACPAAPEPGLWTANYPDIDEGFGPQAPFAIAVSPEEALTRIDIHSSEIYTDLGLHLGSSLDEVLGVYPGGPDAVINHADVSDVYVFKGTKGQLQFEVAVDRVPDYWDPSAIDTVVFMDAIDISLEPFGVAATDNVVGVCPVG